MSTSEENQNESELSYYDPRICVIGLGSVGLPLAQQLCKKFKTIGFDISNERAEEVKNNELICTSDIEAIRNCIFLRGGRICVG